MFHEYFLYFLFRMFIILPFLCTGKFDTILLFLIINIKEIWSCMSRESYLIYKNDVGAGLTIINGKEKFRNGSSCI